MKHEIPTPRINILDRAEQGVAAVRRSFNLLEEEP